MLEVPDHQYTRELRQRADDFVMKCLHLCTMPKNEEATHQANTQTQNQVKHKHVSKKSNHWKQRVTRMHTYIAIPMRPDYNHRWLTAQTVWHYNLYDAEPGCPVFVSLNFVVLCCASFCFALLCFLLPSFCLPISWLCLVCGFAVALLRVASLCFTGW